MILKLLDMEKHNEPQTRPKNIYVVGAQCTGKTTLVDALVAHFDTSIREKVLMATEPFVIKEVARKVLQKHNFTALDITSSPERALLLQKLILAAQYEAEGKTTGDWYISDRSGVDPIVYAKVYVGGEAFSEMLQMGTSIKLFESMRNGLVCVCETNPDWLKDDGVRLMPKDVGEFTAFHETFIRVLQELGIKYTLIGKDTDVSQRVDTVLKAWKSFEGTATSY